MKIIGKTAFGYLVEADNRELALASGFSSTYDAGWIALIGREGPVIGTTLNVNAAYDFHSRIAHHQDNARKSSSILRALADMLDGVMPDVVIPVDPPDEQKDGSGT